MTGTNCSSRAESNGRFLFTQWLVTWEHVTGNTRDTDEGVDVPATRKSLVGIGTLLGLAWILVVLNTVRAMQSNAGVSSRVVGFAIPLALAFTLFAGAVGITYYGLTQHSFRIACWTALGTIVVMLAVILNTLGLEAVRPDFQLAMFMLTNAAAGGAVLGLMVGVYDAHQQRVTTDLQRKTGTARALSQRLSVINRILRHDTRNQAQIIQSHTETLLSGDADTETAATNIKDANDRLAKLADQARELQSLLDGNGARNEVIDVIDAVREAGRTVGAVHEELIIEYDLPERQVVDASPLVEQAVEQLLYNAVEHNDTDHPRVRVGLTVDQDRATPVELVVEDNGPGIREDEPVRTGAVEETQLRHSSGVGLWYVRWMVEDVGGTMEIETTDDGTGTIVRLRFPTPQ